MLTIAGGIVLGFLAIGVLRGLFGGPSRAEALRGFNEELERRMDDGERRHRK